MPRSAVSGCLAVLVSMFLGAGAEGAIKLKSVRFPDGLDEVTGTKSPPTQSPLSQRVVFVFSGKPKIGAAVGDALRIRVGDDTGARAIGTYEVDGKSVVFTPRLPTAEIPVGFGNTSDPSADATLPGLLPSTTYAINVAIGIDGGVKNLNKIKGNLSLPTLFTTTGDPEQFFSNAPDAPPKLKAGKTKPKPGAAGIGPNPFTDPAGLFSGIPTSKQPPFKLVFKGPIDPSAENLSGDRLRLTAVFGPGGVPLNLPISVTSSLSSNQPDKAVVLVHPRGILPLGHTLRLEVSDLLRALSGAAESSAPVPVFETVGDYVIALDPDPGTAIDDRVLEDFVGNMMQDTSVGFGVGSPAAWDTVVPGALKATGGFGGIGELGRFEAPDDIVLTIHLDTDSQSFPLLSGSTPDVDPGTVVEGGVFQFTDFHLPANVTLVARGSRPLVLLCSGDCTIEGRIDLNGSNGASDSTFDSAVTRIAGGTAGPGGGKGGDGHPVASVPLGGDLKTLMSPPFGESGFGPGGAEGGGGGGGQSGCTMPWPGFTTSTCTQFSAIGDGSRAAGGGGGSFNVFFPELPEDPGALVSGRRGAIGVGDHLPVTFDPNLPIPAEPDAYLAQPGNPTNAVAKPNPNQTFAEAYNAGLIFDEGTPINIGGAWPQTKRVLLFGDPGPGVFRDADPDNNFLGPGGELSELTGGEGGGAGGSRTEGISQICKTTIFDTLGLPFTVLDARGGGGGGAGGGFLCQVGGVLTVQGASALIEARGGQGGGGEQIGNSQRGGGGAGGSGGVVILQGAGGVIMNDPMLPAVVIDVSPGCGLDAIILSGGSSTGAPGGDSRVLQVGDSGPGGPGLVQIHAPSAATVDTSKVNAELSPSMFNIGCGVGQADGLSDFNPLVDMSKTPILPQNSSVARSTWYDLGAVTSAFRPPVVTSAGPLSGPLFGVPGQGPFFKGTDPLTGLVATDETGNVLDPFQNDLEVDSPDLGFENFIPNGPTFFQSVEVTFEGADEDPSNPGLPDPTTATGFQGDPTQLNGKRFVRFQVRFNLMDEAPLSEGDPADLPKPQMNFLRIPFKY